MEKLKGSKLIAGKLYTFFGKNNREVWPLFSKRPTRSTHYSVVANLWPLEPFVFLERLASDYRQDDYDKLYDYKILTTKGEVLWLNIHDDDLEASGIGFREFGEDLL